MAQRRLADRALELEHLVGQHQRVAVAQVDLHLRRAFLVDQRVDLQLLLLGEIVDIVEQVVELVDRGDRIGLPRRLRPSRAPGRRLQRIVRVLVRLDQIELDLRCHHRHPAAIAVEFDYPPQHLARRDLHRPSVGVIGVVDDLRRRIALPRHHRQGGEVRLQMDVLVGAVVLEGLVVMRPVAGDGLGEDRHRHGHGRPGEELLHRHHLAARHARLVGNDALDVLHAARADPGLRLCQRCDAPGRIGTRRGLLLACHRSPCVVAAPPALAESRP